MRHNLLNLLLSVFLVLAFAGSINGQITIKYEQEGAGEPELEYLNTSFTPTFMKLTPGDNVITDMKFGYKQNIGAMAFELIIRPNAETRLTSVIIDGVENAEYLETANSGNNFIHYLRENKPQTISIKLVYEGEYQEKEWTQKLNSMFAGEGTVKCTYEDNQKGEQTVVLEGGETNLDVKKGEDNMYRMRVSAEPAEGKIVKYITVNGADVKKEYAENGYYEIVKDTEKETTSLIVEFDDAPRADMIVEYNYGGEGTVNYYYYEDAESQAKKEGTFNQGENLLNGIYYSDNYRLYVVPVPASGYVLNKILISGNEDTEKKAEFDENGYFILETPVAGETVMLTIMFAKEDIKMNKVTVKANGDVFYQIKYSNIEAGKQEFYNIENEDVVLELPDNAFCSWTYSYNPDFIVKGLKVNGEYIEYSFIVNSDLEIELDYIESKECTILVGNVENGEVYLEKEVFSSEKGGFVYEVMQEGEYVLAGTKVRISAYADPGYEIKDFNVNGATIVSSTENNSLYEYIHIENLWEDMNVEVTFEAMPTGLKNVSVNASEMKIYSIDGVLLKTCRAGSIEEATSGLEDGLYIVNGRKVAVKGQSR